MVKIIIVEDDEEMQKKIKLIVIKALFSKNIEFEIHMFKNYNEELKKCIDDNSQSKVFLLDIELKRSISGIDIANIIRKEDWESEIVFLTNHDKMFEKVYRTIYKVFDFIEKYHDLDNRLLKVLRIIMSNNHDNKMLKITNKNMTLQLYYKDILYITRDTIERKLIIYTTTNKFTLLMPISKCLEKLDGRFKMVHRACIVNSDRVVKYNWNKKYFILDNGAEVYLLSKKYKGVIQDGNN